MTDPQTNLSVTITWAEKSYGIIIEKEWRSGFNWW